MKKFVIVLMLPLLGLFFNAPLKASTAPPDSLGIRMINGKAYIMHKVDPGETLYRISKRYKVSTESIQAANRMDGVTLSVGQIIKVPVGKGAQSMSLKNYVKENDNQGGATSATSTGGDPVDASRNFGGDKKTHVVAPKETLYSISKLYGISVEDLKSVNKLQGNDLKIGQILIVKIGETQGSGSGANTTVKLPAYEGNSGTGNTETENNRESLTGDDRTTGQNTQATNQTTRQTRREKGKHVVQPGETLYSISKKYGMSLREIRELNKLIDTDVKEGQELVVWVEKEVEVKSTNVQTGNSGAGKTETQTRTEDQKERDTQPGNADAETGTSSSGNPDSETETEMKDPQESLENTNANLDGLAEDLIPETAYKIKVYDRRQNRDFWRVSERGKAGELAGGKAGFYAAHKTLPKGTLIRVELPRLNQAVTCEVVSELKANSPYVLKLSKKARMYLLLESEDEEIVVKYTLPAAKSGE